MNHILALICLYSNLYALDPRLVTAIVKKESAFDPSAIGAAGEVGLMQLLPSTVGLTKKQLLDPETNIKAGTKYLADMRNVCRWKNNYEFIVCFNLGEAGGNKLRYPEKWSYYVDVMSNYRRYDVKDFTVQNGK